MKSSRSRGMACLWALAFSTCGSGNFADDFASEIQRDCFETAACASTSMTVDACITLAGDRLNNASVSQQQFFVDTVVRCELNQSCAYVNCTTTGALTGYAAMHQTEIMYDCQQKAECRITSGTPLPPNWVTQCAGEQSTILNGSVEQQSAFDARFARCSGQAACNWTICQ